MADFLSGRQKNMKIMKKSILVFFILFPTSIFAQIGISLYPINNTIGIKTTPLKTLSLELRMSFDVSHSTADVLYILQPEVNFIYRICKDEKVNFYSGIGGGYGLNNANGNFTNASFLLGLEFYPVAAMRNFTLTAELDPTANFFAGYQTYKMKGLIGITYYFSKIKNKKNDL